MKRKVIAVLALGTFMWCSSLVFAKSEEKYLNLKVFAKVLNIVQQYYVEEVDIQKIIYGGIKGMLRELDPHTNFLPPKVYEEFQEETSGEFGGIGIEITIKKGVLTIISPIEDTPAWKAGIQPNDKITSIDGTSTKGMNLVEAAQKMKGKNGEVISLGIIRKGLDKPKNYKIKRKIVRIKSVKHVMLDEGFGYVRLTSFIENSATDFKKSLDLMKNKKAGLKGLIIDLRRNPGGLLDQAVKISDFFLDEGIIVSTIGRDKKSKEILRASKGDDYTGFPIVVLINENSASASEIVAGALKDNKRALVMGQRSFGKGSVQSVIKMDDGSGLKLTVARYYTPNGTSIQAEGIVPDVILQNINNEVLSKAIVKKRVKREADISGHLENEVVNKDTSKKSSFWSKLTRREKSEREDLLKKDYQVIQAFNYLKAWKTLKSL